MVKSKFVAFSDHHIFTLQNTSMELVLADPKQYFDNEKVCYQQIWQSYWYAKYGEFTVVIHKAVGYVNVTQLCKTYKKHFYHWSANKNVKALIAGLAEKLTLNGCPVTTEQMLIVIKGGTGQYKAVVSGTYVHPILLPHIASWLDHSFAGVVSIMTNNFCGLQTRTGSLESILQDEKKPEPKLETDDGDDSDDDDIKVDRTILKKSFKIFARKDTKFPYQAIETVEKGMAAAIKRFQKTPTGTTELLLEIDGIPDVVSLYNLIKSAGIIQTNKNAFKSKFACNVLIEKIKELSWSNVTREEWVLAVLKSDLAMSDDEE